MSKEKIKAKLLLNDRHICRLEKALSNIYAVFENTTVDEKDKISMEIYKITKEVINYI